MKVLFFLLGLGLLLNTTACTSKPRKAGDATLGPMTPDLQARRQLEQTSVFVRGEVRNPIIPWTEGLTLSQAIAAADYLPRIDPWAIYHTRQGQTRLISPRKLLNGSDDPLLEPGDVVEIRR